MMQLCAISGTGNSMGRHLWHYEMLRNQVIKATILEQGTGISHQLDYKCSLFTTAVQHCILPSASETTGPLPLKQQSGSAYAIILTLQFVNGCWPF